MFKETITYTDYNGVERTEDFLFNLTEAEIMEMEMGVTGGLAEQIQRVTQTQDGPTIIKIFKDLVLNSHGVKSPDGKRFIKNDEIRAAFEQNPAYSIIFMKYATDADAASKFVNGIIPQKLSEKAALSITPNAL
jgi:hypothetical protein